MKLILSRKGYDLENGGMPSPILPDGTMVSIPIPDRDDKRTYGEILCRDGTPLAKVVADLKLFQDDHRCHLDPDLAHWSVARREGWRPAFGQINHSQSHLHGKNVGAGDLFLFFGWFRRTEYAGGRLRFVRGKGEDKHVIFGWLEIDRVLGVGETVAEPHWLLEHPHCHPERRQNPTNAVYVARESLSLKPSLPGGGVFPFAENLVLTKEGMTRTRWALDPKIFRGRSISYHDETCWKDGYFQSRSKGQEFVIEPSPEVHAWARGLFERL